MDIFIRPFSGPYKSLAVKLVELIGLLSDKLVVGRLLPAQKLVPFVLRGGVLSPNAEKTQTHAW